MKRATALKRELPAAIRIPYRSHVSPHVVRTEAGDYVQVFKIAGASFESADDEVLNNWHERLNVLWRNIASPQVALWTHIVRRRELAPAAQEEGADFASRLATKYRQRLSTETLMANTLYLSMVYRPVAGAAPGLISKLAAKGNPRALTYELADALDASEKLAQTVDSSLARYEPERLAVYPRNARAYSQLLEFFSLLINGEEQPVPLPTAPSSASRSTPPRRPSACSTHSCPRPSNSS